MEIKKKIIKLPKINNKRKNKRLNHLNIEINEKNICNKQECKSWKNSFLLHYGRKIKTHSK